MKIKKLHFIVLAAVVSGLLFTACNPKTTPPAEETIAAQVKQPEWSKNLSIYEVNVRQFSPEGTFAAVEAQLPRLKELGTDILWLMPIHPIGELNRKGTLGSYYSIKE